MCSSPPRSHLMVRRLFARTFGPTAAALIVAVFAGALVGGPATAGIIFGSGERQSTNPADPGYALDKNWKVVALPAGPGSPNLVLDPNYYGLYSDPWFGWTATLWTPPNTGSPTAGYVPGGTAVAATIPTTLPSSFYGMGGSTTQPGIVVDGVTYNWISASTTTNGSALWGSPYNQSDYNWIVAQTFVVDIPFYYDFTFQSSGDNAVQFFIDGSVSTALQDATAAARNGYWSDSVHPTIVGGTALSTTINGTPSTYWNNFGALGTFTGKGYLTSGTHTAYMVLHDVGGMTAAFISQATFEVSTVPEIDPAGMGSVLSLVVGSLGLLERRRIKAA